VTGSPENEFLGLLRLQLTDAKTFLYSVNVAINRPNNNNNNNVVVVVIVVVEDDNNDDDDNQMTLIEFEPTPYRCCLNSNPNPNL